jgi:hypothetical protein
MPLISGVCTEGVVGTTWPWSFWAMLARRAGIIYQSARNPSARILIE